MQISNTGTLRHSCLLASAGTAPLATCDEYQQVDYMPFDPSVKRTEGTLVGPDGKRFKTTKGAPQIIMNLCHNKAEVRYRITT